MKGWRRNGRVELLRARRPGAFGSPPAIVEKAGDESCAGGEIPVGGLRVIGA